ncbi:MAG: AbrB/MazE/SpoVT family DNA-binding domain-containing protein [Thermoanaerobaculia bacterium]
MRTSIQQWGNSLAVRIPKPFAEEAGIEQRSAVEMSVVDGKIVIVPERRSCPELDELLAGVTDENLHSEIDTGPTVGKEVW